MNTFPNDLGGNHPLAAWGNKLLRAARACAVAPGVGYDLYQSASGTSLKIGRQNAGIIFPFQIYQTSTWLKFKVTTGWVITTGDAFIPTDVETEMTLTSGVDKFYFTIAILSASSATISTSSTLPAWGVDVIPIGWVDTNTYAASSESRIYQFLHDNVFSPCVT